MLVAGRAFAGNLAAMGGTAAAQNLKQIIDALGIGTGLVLCVDAGATGSYPGTGQTWTDLSGSNNNFFLGTTSSVETQDPTFNGTAGALTANEYFSNDGGDRFRGTATFVGANGWHQDNGTFTIIGMGFLAGTQMRFLQTANTSGPLVDTYFAASKITLEVTDDSGGTAFQVSATATATASAWNFIAVAQDEGANSLFFRTNTTTQTVAGAYTSPGTNSLSGQAELFTSSASGSRLGCVAAWGRKLTTTEIGNLYTELKKRYTTLP